MTRANGTTNLLMNQLSTYCVCVGGEGTIFQTGPRRVVGTVPALEDLLVSPVVFHEGYRFYAGGDQSRPAFAVRLARGE